MPNDANDAVQAAVDEALNGDAESQAANESNPEVADALKDVLGSEDESASDDETSKSAEETGEKAQAGLKKRLSQVVKQRNEISERYKNLEDKYKTANQTEQELRSRIGPLEQDHQILDAIKNLAQNEKYRDHVVAIDRALQGLDEEIDEAQEKGDKKAESEAVKEFKQKTEELEDLLADQRAENLWDSSYSYARQRLEALPDEYTEEDKAVIGELWTRRVDWDKIEAEGSDVIPSVLDAAYVDVLKRYGTPRGALVAKTTKEVESRIPGARVVSDDDSVKSILGKDWGAHDDSGKAKHSDDEFNQDFADLLRRINRP